MEKWVAYNSQEIPIRNLEWAPNLTIIQEAELKTIKEVQAGQELTAPNKPLINTPPIHRRKEN